MKNRSQELTGRIEHDRPPQPPTTKREFTITFECEVNERHAKFDAAWGLTKWRLIHAIQDALERPRGHGYEMPAKKGDLELFS